MDPISAFRTRVETWLGGDAPHAAPPPAPRDLDPELLPPTSYSPEVVANLVRSDHSRAEPEPQALAVMRAKYTESPKEAQLTRTSPSLRELTQALGKAWPELSEVGVRTLVAQHALETGGGSACWNWNLGNVKGRPTQPHVYLEGVTEALTPADADTLVARSEGKARVATDDEVRKHGWSCPPGHVVAVFEPPHPATCFRAFATLAEGVKGWVGQLQAVERRAPGLVAAANSGDAAALAHALKTAGYYTAAEDDYAKGIERWQPKVDVAQGWVP